MLDLPFYIVDVFAESKYAGNQLAVVRNAESLSTEEMQKIAQEMNYSETTFILSDNEREGGYDVRIFTISEELSFAGHPTLGTAYVIQREIVREPVEEIILNLKIGQVPVKFTYKNNLPDVMWMRHKPPVYGQEFHTDRIASVLTINRSEIYTNYPVQTVSTGTPFIIVPIYTLDAMKRVRVNADQYLSLIRQADARWMLLFTPQTYHPHNDLNARMFVVDSRGVGEDAATGSANGCLAAYLAHHRFFGSNHVNARVEQGYEIGRPSLLLLHTEYDGQSLKVLVGGNVIMVAAGEFF
jgi:trans-2,3-dihydro-3-hydroxyanthranilate isomerase